MSKIWTIVIDLLIAILIIVVSVLVYFGIRTESVVKTAANNKIDTFITDIKKKGYLSQRDYEGLINSLSFSDILCDIEFEHKHEIYEPEYRFRSLEEIIEAQNAAYTGDNTYNYRDVITDVPIVPDPENNDQLNTETNETVLANAVNDPPNPSHTHTEDCYEGHIHIPHTGFTHYHAHTYACKSYLADISAWADCVNCGKHYQSYWYSSFWNLQTNSQQVVGAETFSCPTCNSTNKINETMYQSWGYSCYYVKDINGDALNDLIPVGETHEYIMGAPQNTSISQTYNSGCYSYHTSFIPERRWEPNYNDYFYTENGLGSQRTSFLRLYNNNFNFCEVPSIYEIKYVWDGWQGRMSAAVTYELIDTAGSMKFKFKLASGVPWWTPSYPDLTLSELVSITYESNLRQFISNNIDDSFYHPGTKNVEVYITLKGRYVMHTHDYETDRWVLTCGKDGNGHIACGSKIVNITPTHPTQTVYVNDPLITTVRATYLDGSTKVLVAATSFITNALGKDQKATLTYTYDLFGTIYTKSCDINVTVVPRNKTCENGHIYNLNADGTDPGCPYCRAWVRTIRVIYPSTSTLTITIGTSLMDNGVTLLITYFDGHTETITSGYEDNLDKYYLGTKPVTIGYKGVTTQLMVTTVRPKMTCDICGFIYELYPDYTNPGCPKCISKTPVFTGNVLNYDVTINTNEILEKIYAEGMYRFDINDTFTIRVVNRNSGISRSLLKKIFPSLTDKWFMIRRSEKIKG